MTKVSRKEPYGIPLGKRRLKKALKKVKTLYELNWCINYIEEWMTVVDIQQNTILDENGKTYVAEKLSKYFIPKRA